MTWSALTGVLACCAITIPGAFVETGCTEAGCGGLAVCGDCCAAALSEINNKAVIIQRVMSPILFSEKADQMASVVTRPFETSHAQWRENQRAIRCAALA